MTSSADGQDRLQEIWAAWSLTPDETMSKAQLGALDAVAKWLEAGQTDPEVMIRAVQLMLADPERPDVRQRASWKALRRAVQESWTNAGTFRDHFSYGQALLLATWPKEENGWLRRAALLDSAWVLRKGREPKEFGAWRTRANEELAPALGVAGTSSRAVNLPQIGTFGGITLDTANDIKHINGRLNHQIEESRKQIFNMLSAHDTAIQLLAKGLTTLSTDTAKLTDDNGPLANAISRLNTISSEVRDGINKAVGRTESKLDLLWWGQSRYCRTLRKPYLRMKSDPSALLWWTAREAAELSQSVEVEPAAAYLVETLHTLDQNIDDKKSVVDWMQELHRSLKQAGDKVPRLSARLEKIAKEDCLGMPVTWVRRRVMDKDDFNADEAKNDVALLLDEEIDRGEWASWVFRETLLDLHLAGRQ